MPAELSPLSLLLELPVAVQAVGYEVLDHAAVIAALAPLELADVPAAAVPKRRAEFMAGRFAALAALRKLGLDGAPGRNADGSPSWPEAVVGSITHGAGRAICAVAHRGEFSSLGIDAEQKMKASTSRELVSRICSEGELATLERALALPEHELVSIAFSAKESLYKCLYPRVGRYQGFEAARVVAVEPRRGEVLSGTLTFELSQDWSDELRAGRRFEGEYAMASSHVETAVVLRA